MASNFIPRHSEDFDTFFKRLTQYVSLKSSGSPPDWSHIPQDARDELNTAYGNWYTAFVRTLGPHTSVDTNERNRVRAESERILRAFINQFLRYAQFSPVTDMDRDAMGIPNRDLIRTPHIDVEEVVEFALKLRNIREVLIEFWIKGASHRAKPEGYDGAVLVWDILDRPPERPEDLNRHTMASRTPHALEFDETERGKTVYISAAWQNARGHIGQWSEIQSAIVP